VDRIWRLLTWWPIPLALAVVMVGSAVVAVLVPQVGLGSTASTAELRSLLPGVFGPSDMLHSAVFLAATLGLGVSITLIATDRLLADNTVGVGWFFEAVVWLGVLGILVFALLHLFLFREVTVTVAPGETVQVPGLDVTFRASVTGWTPEDGSLATLEFVPRLAGGELVGPFGDQDRPADARLAADSVDVSLEKGETVETGGVRLRLREPPPAWAARVKVSWQGRTQTSPFLQSGQGWIAAQLFTDSVLTVAMERVIPDFRRDVSIIAQALGGPAAAPAAIVTLAQENSVVGSMALAPGDSVVMGEFPVLLEGFAPVVEVVMWKGSYLSWVLGALGVVVAGAVGWAVSWFVDARQLERAEAS